MAENYAPSRKTRQAGRHGFSEGAGRCRSLPLGQQSATAALLDEEGGGFSAFESKSQAESGCAINVMLPVHPSPQK
jgi:hypothetical protein